MKSIRNALILGLLSTTNSSWSQKMPDTHIAFPIGVTQDGDPIPAWLPKDGLNETPPRSTFYWWLDWRKEISRRSEASYPSTPRSSQQRILQFCRHPRRQPRNHPSVEYPPKGRAYNDKTNPAAIYLWRFIGIFGPDSSSTSSWRRHSAHPMGKRSGIDKA